MQCKFGLSETLNNHSFTSNNHRYNETLLRLILNYFKGRRSLQYSHSSRTKGIGQVMLALVTPSEPVAGIFVSKQSGAGFRNFCLASQRKTQLLSAMGSPGFYVIRSGVGSTSARKDRIGQLIIAAVNLVYERDTASIVPAIDRLSPLVLHLLCSSRCRAWRQRNICCESLSIVNVLTPTMKDESCAWSP